MNAKNSISRRNFIEKAATISAIGFAAPHLASGDTARPNSRIHVGLIGCGSMGRLNLDNCASQPDVVVTAACDVWEEHRNIVVNKFKATCKGYGDFREMLRQKDLDAVIIATPPHWHTLTAIAAFEAGKDVYLQKPMTLHLAEAFALRAAVKKTDRICQVGTQIHSGENYRRVVEFVRSGKLGSIATVRTFNTMNQTPDGIGHAPPTPVPAGLDWDFWCGPAPFRAYNPLLPASGYNHNSWMDYGGGWTPGMAPHLIDLPIWALNLQYPLRTVSAGGRFILKDDGDAYDNHEVLWQYPNMTLTWMSSITNSYGFTFQNDAAPKQRLGIYFHGANGTLAADYNTLKIFPEGDKIKEADAPPKSLPSSPGHERQWLDCVKSRQEPDCNIPYHIRVHVPVMLSLLSLKLGRAINFDPDKETIIDDSGAAKLAVPVYRGPWKFPGHYLAES